MELMEEAGRALMLLRQQRPLIHHITNFVTMTDCANVTLAVGASPTMTNAVEEVAEMAGAAKALVLNLGTLQQWTVEAMLTAGKAAAMKGVPIVLDPVGAGGTRFRTEAALRLLEELPLTVIRGNLSEITCLAGKKCGINLGVDSHNQTSIDLDAVVRISRSLGTTVVITGAVDAVSDGSRAALLGNGCPMLTYVTGTGCMTTSLIGCFAAVADPYVAAAAGVTAMGLGGERALALGGDKGPGTFHQLLFDQIYSLTGEAFKIGGKVLVDNGRTE